MVEAENWINEYNSQRTAEIWKTMLVDQLMLILPCSQHFTLIAWQLHLGYISVGAMQKKKAGRDYFSSKIESPSSLSSMSIMLVDGHCCL